jgi:signal transduction histidine kinase/CheY-like chemotaxis protein
MDTMKLIRDFKLGTKVFIGYGLILVLLVLSFIIHLINMNWFNNNFQTYEKIAEDAMLAGRIQANLLESRIAYENFVLYGEETQKSVFEERYNRMQGFIFELEDGINNYERGKEIKEIQSNANDYKLNFKKIVEFKESRDFYYDKLISLGPEIEDITVTLTDDLYSAGQMNLSYKTSYVLRYLLISRLNVAKYLENNKDEYVEIAQNSFLKFDQNIMELEELTTDRSVEEQIDAIKEMKAEFEEAFLNIVTIIEKKNEVIATLKNIGPEISVHAENIKLSIIEEQKTYSPKFKEEIVFILYRIVILSILAFLIAIYISVKMTSIIVRPVTTVTKTFQEISEGDVNLGVRLRSSSKDELGEMSSYFNKFMCRLEAIITQNREHSWIKTGQAELSEVIHREQKLNELGTSIIGFISKYIGAHVGAVYMKQENNTFQLIGSYAMTEGHIRSEIKAGEGLSGQAILDKQISVIREIPDKYMYISSGLGEIKPYNITMVPCLLSDEVICLIELASTVTFTELQLEYLESVRSSIAISLNSVDSRVKLNELLDKTIIQSEELQLQQEELRQSNEELEEQAIALRDSEELLQQQQEELKVINEELMERTKTLVIQKDDIIEKNISLLKAQTEIEEKAKALEIASKYKSEFFANMSHELRTPLNSILVLSQLLASKKDNEPLTQKQKEFASTINSAGNDLLRLINDILDMSKVEAGKLIINAERVNLSELAENCEKVFGQIAINKGLSFNTKIDNALPQYIITDPYRLQQILNNLLSNALKFTDQGKVTLRIMQPDLIEIKDLDIPADQTVAFRISDTGIGIPAEKHKEIFEAFKQSDGTTSRKYGGTGLGLYITKQLTELLGGSIHLTSQDGIGSCFTLVLPINHKNELPMNLDQASEVSKEESISFYKPDIMEVSQNVSISLGPEHVISTETFRKTLLIIEDDKEFAKLLSDLASSEGYTCMIAHNGEKGIQLAKEKKPSAIILDIGLPDIDGWKVAEVLRYSKVTRDIPIHIISGSELEKVEDYKNGIIGYLQKPINIADINDIIEHLDAVINRNVKKVLMVDSDYQHSFDVAEVLNKQGILVKCVDTGNSAFDLLRKDSYDCIILDIKLNDMSGFDFLGKLREKRTNQIPVIINTEKELTKEEDDELKRQAECIIIKGSRSIHRLVDEVNMFLNSLNAKQENCGNISIRSSREKELTLEGGHVLIVDDDMRNVFALTGVLEEKGINVIVGRNGKEGIEKLKQKDQVDLVLMDIMMPEMDGYTTIKEIRGNNKYKNLPIFALTAKAMKEDRTKCIEAGANEYLTKPIDTEQLISLMKVWLYQ